MATKSTKGSLSGGKVKFRVIEFELEGSDESLHDGLKNLATALMRGQGAPPTRQIANGAKPAPAAADGAQPEDEDQQDDEVVDAEVADLPSPRRLIAPRKAKPVTVKVLHIEFGDVSPTLKEFYDSKKPTNALDKYLVIAYWYKNHKGISDLTVDHFHTALRFLDQPTPKDALQPIRDLRKRNRGKLSGGASAGTSAINHVGENAVREMGKGS